MLVYTFINVDYIAKMIYTVHIKKDIGVMFKLKFYETKAGKKPIEDFLISLDNKMRTKAIHELMLLRERGTELREPYSKAIGDGIFELRIQLGSDASRIFYFFYVDYRIVLTNGFIKKSQKTPLAELDKAKRYKKDYEERQNG
jgi:phage-related protein